MELKWKKILLWLSGILVAAAGGNQAAEVLGYRAQYAISLLSEASNAATAASVINTYDADIVVCAVGFGSIPSSTIKFLGSASDTQPTFTAAQSSTNQYEFLGGVDMQSLSNVAGDTGVTASTTADVRMLKIETKHIKWFTADIITSTSATSMGTVTVQCIPSNTK